MQANACEVVPAHTTTQPATGALEVLAYANTQANSAELTVENHAPFA